VTQVMTEFDDEDGRRSARYSASVHEVLGVVDARSRRVLSFSDALRRRLVDPATGNYRDHVTGRTVYPADAIRQGLIKTRILGQQSDAAGAGCAAWLVPTGSPVLPGELGTVAVFEPADQLALQLDEPPVFSPATSDTAPPTYRVRRTISGWLLDLP